VRSDSQRCGRGELRDAGYQVAHPNDCAVVLESHRTTCRCRSQRRRKLALGDGNDPAKDFNFGKDSRERTYAKAGQNVASVLGTSVYGARWKAVNLPHDWALDLPFVAVDVLDEQGGKEIGRSYPASSVGWYHRAFKLSESDKGRRISVEFDGVMRAATVFFNGHYIGENFSGYAPFSFDVTDWVNLGGDNTLVVRCDVSFGEGWFYEGAGIYRHVWLTKTAPLHLVQWGTAVRSDLGKNSATIRLQSEVLNQSDQARTCAAQWEIFDPAQKSLGTVQGPQKTLGPGETAVFEGTLSVSSPQLWSCEQPALHSALVSVSSDGKLIDQTGETFGIRSIRFDPNKGFFLNGQPVKIKGTCNHQDHAGVGAALPDRLQYYRLERLKAMGSNALRTSHNPPTPEFLEAADRLGMLVMCETRMMDSNPEGLSQLSRMVRRFRNHPSIIIWSLGNEEPEQGSARGANIATTMKRLTRQLDPTRPTTIAMNSDQGKGVSAVVDVQGFNYNEGRIDGFHTQFSKQPIIGTETASTLTTRGVYVKDDAAGHKTAYDVKDNVPGWGSTAESWWKFYAEREYLAGGFAWTGFDYRGEPTPFHWPCISSHFGIMDTCGFPKDNFYFYRAWWQPEPVLHLFPHWNWASDGTEMVPVWVHSNLDSVELFLNGKTLGSLVVKPFTHLEWQVKFEPGTIEARGSKHGKVVLVEKRESTGAPAKLRLTADRATIDANGEDLSMITVEVLDGAGSVVPTANTKVNFTLTGAGTILGVGNGDPSCTNPTAVSARPPCEVLSTACACPSFNHRRPPVLCNSTRLPAAFSPPRLRSSAVQPHRGRQLPERIESSSLGLRGVSSLTLVAHIGLSVTVRFLPAISSTRYAPQ
jgi:beta-galactosidase